jgi:predicted NAD/FAD-binding protein
MTRARIAVIGGGVAGIGAAHRLQRKFDVFLFEKNDYLGGHTHTIELPDGPDRGMPVDTGFIVMNHRNYPNLLRFCSELGVKTQPSDMSLSVQVPSEGLFYSSDFPRGLFAQRRNLWRGEFYRMMTDIFRFFAQARKALKNIPALEKMTLREFLAQGRYSQFFIDGHLVPMASAIWSTPPGRILDFPVLTLLNFYKNHGLLGLGEQPEWRTVAGGSHSYVKAFRSVFKGEIRLNADVQSIRRQDGGVTLRLGKEEEDLKFDKAVIAVHADEALKLLGDATPDEKRLLGAWEYSANRTILHSDRSLMPPARAAWASWNVTTRSPQEGSREVSVTYYMNRLQRLRSENEYFVSLNEKSRLDPASVTAEFLYHHPTYTFKSLESQKELPRLNQTGNIVFCGSYFGHGFHEDAIRSGFEAAKCLEGLA